MPQRIEHLKKLITNYQRRLNKLKERQALLGHETPTTVLLEIEDVEANLAEARAELKQLEEEATRPMGPVAPARTRSYPAPPPRLFICYKQYVLPDQSLAAYLHDFLTAQGQAVFFEQEPQAEQGELKEIDRRIESSHFLIVLLSEESAHSEMVQAEVKRAYDHYQRQGRPRILTVRVAYEQLLPYPIDAYLDPSQYILWRSEADNERVGRDILAAMSGQLPSQPPIQAEPAGRDSVISEDGYPVADDDTLHPPLPACDPRLLENLEAPGGTVKLRDRLYIEREADAHLKRQTALGGSIITIRAPRQTGKSSLLVRGVHHARQKGARVVSLDLQQIDSSCLEVPDLLLRCLAGLIVRKLRLDPARVDRIWQRSSGPQAKLTALVEEYVLPSINAPVVLALDEADSLLQTDFYDDFFGMLRSWHNSAAYDYQWEKLTVVLVISTEPYLLIARPSQSPFNVGLKLYLGDFNEAQVRELNWRHGSPVQERHFGSMMRLLNGHPYLTRKALYTMVTERLSWTELNRVATAEEGPFGDHLRRQQWLLRAEPELQALLKQILETDRRPDEASLFRLLRAGLIQRHGDSCAFRCDLYRRYFEDKL